MRLLWLAWTFYGLPPTEGLGLDSWHAFLGIDFTGIAFLLGSSICMIYGFQDATTGGHDWSHPPVIATLVLAGAYWIGFFGWEIFLAKRAWSSMQPIFPMRIMKRRIVAVVFLSIFLTGFPFVTIMIILTERFQLVNHTTSLMSGICLLLLLAVAVGLDSFIVGITDSKKNRTFSTLFLAAGLQLLGLGLLTTIDNNVAVTAKQFGFQLRVGLGIGMSLACCTVMVTIYSRSGEMAATVAQPRPLGGVIGLRIAITLFNSRSDAQLGEFLTLEQIAALHRSPLAALGFASQELMSVRSVYANIFRSQMQMLMYVEVIGVLVAAETWERRRLGEMRENEAV